MMGDDSGFLGVHERTNKSTVIMTSSSPPIPFVIFTIDHHEPLSSLLSFRVVQVGSCSLLVCAS
eukprot:m.9430 g.9430  ORF g.9430 m.9430 type:complete len:64 (+) comp7707_c0_seq1:214-405(+)